MGKSNSSGLPSRRPTFTITCAVLAILGFGQLMAVAVAAALRSGETREVIKYVKSDPIIVSIPTLPEEVNSPKNIKPRTLEQILEQEAGDYTPKIKSEQPRVPLPAIPGQFNNEPPIANAQVRELISEAHQLHVGGDIVRALLKLDTATDIDPEESAIHYRRALLYQDMGQWKKAGDEYEKLFLLGPSIGPYYHRAAHALAHGIAPKINNQGRMILGKVIERVNEKRTSTELIIPVRSNVQDPIEPEFVEIKIHFYDIVDGKNIEPVPNERKNNINFAWLAEPADWTQGGEETLRATYKIPPLRLADVHLFGDRKYYGHVAQLYYKGELLDQQANPRKLHAIHAKGNNAPQLPGNGLLPDLPLDFENDPFPLEEPLPNIDPDNLLLPPLPRK